MLLYKAFQEPSIRFELGSLCDLQLRNQAVDLNILQRLPRRDNGPSRCQDIQVQGSWESNSKYMSVQYGWAAVILGQLLCDVSWRDRNQRHQNDLRLEGIIKWSLIGELRARQRLSRRDHAAMIIRDPRNLWPRTFTLLGYSVRHYTSLVQMLS